MLPPSGATLNGGVTMNIHTLFMETHWQIVQLCHNNSHITRRLSFRLLNEGFCSPPPKFMKWPHDFQMKKIWCLKKKLWSKVIFSKCVQRADTSAWFAHVTDCYSFGKRNLNKVFLTTKPPFGRSRPILVEWLWTTLVAFIWQ